MSMELSAARNYAQKLIEAMQPYCEQCEIAGSIRRGKAEVKDIELVAIPKWEMGTVSTDLFGSTELLNCALVWAYDAEARGEVQWIKPGTNEIVSWNIKPDGKYWRGILPCGIKLDLFLATPENFGVIQMIRTGAASFSQAMVTRGLKIGKRFQNGFLTEHGEPVATPTERDVFQKLGVAWIEPSARHDESSMRIIGFTAEGE